MQQFDPQAKPFYPEMNQKNIKEKREIRSAILHLFSKKSEFVKMHCLADNYVDLARVLRTRRLEPYSIELLLDVVDELVYLEKQLEYNPTRILIRSVG